jgi:pimeloyl-ACP methyl ester carboxylesterase
MAEELIWRHRRVHWSSRGSGPPVVLCHGTPWSSRLWERIADALSAEYTVYLWDMPGYGESSKDPGHSVALDVQGELFHDLLEHWELDAPHVIAHDYGGAVALRAHLLHGSRYASLALVDVWHSPRGDRTSSDWCANTRTCSRRSRPGSMRDRARLHRGREPRGAHRGAVGHARGAVARRGRPAAFYRQIAEADQRYTDEVEPLYPSIDLPVLIVWGTEDSWIPVDRAHRLASLIPGAQLKLIENAGHLIQLDQPRELEMVLRGWLPSTR